MINIIPAIPAKEAGRKPVYITFFLISGCQTMGFPDMKSIVFCSYISELFGGGIKRGTSGRVTGGSGELFNAIQPPCLRRKTGPLWMPW